MCRVYKDPYSIGAGHREKKAQRAHDRPLVSVTKRFYASFLARFFSLSPTL
jgi:hypothetical protein